MSKRDQIINAAVEVFAEQGLEKGKIADIAKKAGIGKGTVYEYFNSKNDLFAAIEDYFIAGMFGGLEQMLADEESPRRKIELIMTSSIDLILNMGNTMLIVSEIMTQGVRGIWNDEGSSTLADMYGKYRSVVTGILKDGVKAGEFREMNYTGVATLLMAFIDGLVWQYLIIRDKINFDIIKNEAICSFIRGIER